MEVGKMSSEKNFTERLRTWAVLTVFPAALLLISVVDMLRPAKLYSTYENRKLQQKPEISVQAVRTGSYMKEYEEYVSDQILGRNSYIAIKSATDKALGKKEINGVYLAHGGIFHTEYRKDPGRTAETGTAAAGEEPQLSGITGAYGRQCIQ